MNARKLSVSGVVVVMAAALACSDKTAAPPTAPSVNNSASGDGSTLKASAPSPQSPANDAKLGGMPITFNATPATAEFAGGVPLEYRFQVMNGGGAVVAESGLMNGTSWTLGNELTAGNARHTWRVRAEYQGAAGPWSSPASFVSPDPALINDPLTNGRTVGRQNGGHFVAGGWQSDSLTDTIDYDIPTCASCTVEFDITNIGKKEGETFAKDLKWISMGEGGAFGDFNAFRNHPWKMHLEQRGDGDGSGMKLIWRNGDAGDGEPGDHTQKMDPGVDWRGDQVFHFVLRWTPAGFNISVNGRVWFEDGFGGHPYAPPSHRIQLGCSPRAESFPGIIFRNVKVTKNN